MPVSSSQINLSWSASTDSGGSGLAGYKIYRGGVQIGKVTSTTWSPLLKKMIALGSVPKQHAKPGTKLQMEYTIEAVRQKVGASVVPMPFFNPPRKTATPVE